MANDALSFEDIQRSGKVVPFSVVRDVLSRTEPVVEHVLETDGSSEVRLTVPEGWNLDLKKLDDTNLTTASISYKGKDYLLTKRAILTLLHLIGISDRYAYKSPGHLIEPQLNYWFENEGVGNSSRVKLVTKDDYAVAFMGENAPIISNLTVLEEIRKFFKQSPSDPKLYVDPQIVNNYMETDFRIILPEVQFEVEVKRNGEVEIDRWHYGIHVTNSLTSYSAKPLTISGFMVEQRSLAGILPEYSQTNNYVRNTMLDMDDVRGWVGSTLSQVLAILPTEAELIQHISEHSLQGRVGYVTSDIFRTMKIHRKVQEVALDILAEEGDMTSYGLMMALSSAVSPKSKVKFLPKVVNHVQRVAGSIPMRAEDICDGCGRIHLQD
jgi:hypothetical protein